MEAVNRKAGRTFLLRGVLLIMLIVGFGVGLVAFTVGNAFASFASFVRGATIQSSARTR